MARVPYAYSFGGLADFQFINMQDAARRARRKYVFVTNFVNVLVLFLCEYDMRLFDFTTSVRGVRLHGALR